MAKSDMHDPQAFIRRTLARQGSFMSDRKDAYYRAARALAKEDASLELIMEEPQTMTGLPVYKFGKLVGWGGRKTFSGGWVLRRK